jgi:hypothetical protein
MMLSTIVMVATMHVARAAHTVSALPAGRVLIAGGMPAGGDATRSFEVFDTSRNALTASGDMLEARAGHTATPLPDGRVIVAGGYNGSYLATIEVFDPRSGRFAPAGRMTVGRSGHTATLLRDGTILFTGGNGEGYTFLSSAETYDPRSGRSQATGPLTVQRESHTATRLPDGRVLIAGGHRDRREAIHLYREAEIYDPRTRRFTATGSMRVARHKHDAVALADGRVLILGGSDNRDGRGRYASTETYDLARGAFAIGPTMRSVRFKFRDTTVALPNGTVLVGGGSRNAELLVGQAFQGVPGDFGTDLSFAASTALPDGGALIVGGYDDHGRKSAGVWRFYR